MMLTSTLRNLLVKIMTKFNFHRTLAGTVSWNSQYCKDKYYCTGAYLAPTDIRREIYRQSESLLSWITNQNEALEMLHTIVTLWGAYSICSGSLFLLLRCRTFCSNLKMFSKSRNFKSQMHFRRTNGLYPLIQRKPETYP